MKYAIFGDVHANLEALEAVFMDMDQFDIDEYLCVGDVVGYGADPEATIELVKERANCTVAGNHDYAIAGKLSMEYFNAYAREVAEWTMDRLDEDQLSFLEDLPLLKNWKDDLTLVHATFKAPEKFDYILTSYDAHINFQTMDTRVGFLGHSHIPANFLLKGNVINNQETEFTLEEDTRAMVNVGSVGQPRDEDPRASYCLFDAEEEKIEIRRVEYDIDTAANKIYDAGLPELLGERLYYGK